MAVSKERLAYLRSPWGQYKYQKYRAKQRGVGFKLSFEEWLEIWGYCLPYRGKKEDSLCMCRKGDTGNYEVGNVYIGSFKENRDNISVDKHRKHAKINMDIANDIRSCLSQGFTVKQCAKIYGLSRQSITDIRMNRTWRS